MRRVLRFIKWVVVALLLVALLAATGGYIYLRRSLPQVSGTVKVAGLGAPVEIIRDRDGVPHIYGQTKLDALFGLGYAHAQDRLWEMEIWRRIAQGRFAEVFGKQALGGDRFLRTLSLQRSAQQAWAHFPAEGQAEVNAYVAGINAFLADHKASQLPPEFTVLGVTPEPWTSIDAIAWAKIFALDLASNFGTELLARDLGRAVGAERVKDLFPGYPAGGPIITAPSTYSTDGERVLALQYQLESLLGVGAPNGGARGSNSWVVDGTKSTTGKPLLANDPHLTMTLPGWYQAHLSAGDFDVEGATIPGLPGVVIGRNKQIAWGFAGLNPDVQDLYQEHLDSSGRMAEFRGQMEPIQLITETIKVRGDQDVPYLLRVTRHGPLISDVFNQNDLDLPQELKPAQPLEPLALRWTALDPDDTTVLAFLAIDEARNWNDVTQALQKVVAPGLNFVYADVEGNIGYYAAAGRVPIRADGDGTRPVEGWTGEHEWQGWVPFDKLPFVYNPPEHYIVTANNRPFPDGYAYFLGREWYPPYRAQRITDLLRAKDKLSPEDFGAIQNDTVSLQARELLPVLLQLVTPQNDDQRKAIELLKGWDGDTRGDSAAAAIYETWFTALPRQLLSDDLNLPQRITFYSQNFTFMSQFVNNTLRQPNSPWCDITTTAEREDCAYVAGLALQQALEVLKARLGDNMAAWRWDQLHTSQIYHVPFDNVPLLRPIFSRARPSGGDWSTVNMGAFWGLDRPLEDRYRSPFDFTHRFGPSYRGIFDLSTPDGSRFIQTAGTSGHVLSAHYADFLDDWAAGRYRQMRFSRELVVGEQEAVLRLEPQ